MSLYEIDQKLKKYKLTSNQRKIIIEMVRQFGFAVLSTKGVGIPFSEKVKSL